ncbi:MAG: ribbon-helix-helix protein, CopG family [Aeromicrobium sp.]|uniref:ribbon-helix-helix domain-containing protein n=1 Tax=Aeromicrobium sp. TaxID=1871063 RepID=UPI0039E5797F
MATMNVSLPDQLKEYVDQTVTRNGYQSSSEYIRELIRKDQDVQRFRELILEGLNSPVEGVVDDAFFDELRRRASAS